MDVQLSQSELVDLLARATRKIEECNVILGCGKWSKECIEAVKAELDKYTELQMKYYEALKNFNL